MYRCKAHVRHVARSLSTRRPRSLQFVLYDQAGVRQPAGHHEGRLVPALKNSVVDARPFFSPLTSIPAFRDTAQAKAARARNAAPFGINPAGAPISRGTTCCACARCCARGRASWRSAPTRAAADREALTRFSLLLGRRVHRQPQVHCRRYRLGDEELH